jgi:hypothetical protein
LGLLAVAGCGLGDYEAAMDRERARVKVFDDENKVLGPPLTMPVDLSGQADKQPALLRMEVFLRPPKGFESKPADKDKPANAKGIPLYRYAGPAGGYQLFLAGDLGKLPAEKFQHDVLAALSAYAQEVAKQPLKIPAKPAFVTVLKQPLLGRTTKPGQIRYQSLVLDEPAPADAKEDGGGTRFQVYFHQNKKYQVAVIFQVPRGAQEHEQAIDFSLKTLGIGPEKSAEQRKAYVERLAYSPSKKG